MRILWIKTELLHPVDKGGRIRTYQMLRALNRDHHVTYLCLDDGTAASDALERAAEYSRQAIPVSFLPAPKQGWRFAAALAGNIFSGLPYAIDRYRSKALRERITVAARHADLVVCDFLAPSTNVPVDLPARAVLFQHNVEAVIWQRHAEVPQNPLRRAYMREQWRRMFRYEREQCRRFDHVVAVSASDAEYFRDKYGASSVSSVPTGVDLDYFSASQAETRNSSEIVFIGSMDWLPNEDGILWFMKDVLPELRRRRPDVRLTVVGRSPSAGLRAAAERCGSVEITGTVPDVRPYLSRAAMSVVPLRIGGGTRLKIYEAMAMGTPVVSTSVGAEGLEVVPDEHLVIADQAEAMAAKMALLIEDRQRSDAMAGRALEFVRANCSWNAVADQFIANCTR